MVTAGACPAGMASVRSTVSTVVSTEPLPAHLSTPSPSDCSMRSSLRHSSRRSAESHRVAPRPRRKTAPIPPETMYLVCSARTGVPLTPTHPPMSAITPIAVNTRAALRSHCFLARCIRFMIRSAPLIRISRRGLLVRVTRGPLVGAGERGDGPRPPVVLRIGLRPVQAVLHERVLAFGEDQGTGQTAEGGPVLALELIEPVEEVLLLDLLVGRRQRKAAGHEQGSSLPPEAGRAPGVVTRVVLRHLPLVVRHRRVARELVRARHPREVVHRHVAVPEVGVAQELALVADPERVQDVIRLVADLGAAVRPPVLRGCVVGDRHDLHTGLLRFDALRGVVRRGDGDLLGVHDLGREGAVELAEGRVDLLAGLRDLEAVDVSDLLLLENLVGRHVVAVADRLGWGALREEQRVGEPRVVREVTTDDRDSGLLDHGLHRVDREHLDVAEEGHDALLDKPAPLGDRGRRVALVIRDRKLDRVAVQTTTGVLRGHEDLQRRHDRGEQLTKNPGQGADVAQRHRGAGCRRALLVTAEDRLVGQPGDAADGSLLLAAGLLLASTTGSRLCRDAATGAGRWRPGATGATTTGGRLRPAATTDGRRGTAATTADGRRGTAATAADGRRRPTGIAHRRRRSAISAESRRNGPFVAESDRGRSARLTLGGADLWATTAGAEYSHGGTDGKQFGNGQATSLHRSSLGPAPRIVIAPSVTPLSAPSEA